jgi:hypothetical protein
MRFPLSLVRRSTGALIICHGHTVLSDIFPGFCLLDPQPFRFVTPVIGPPCGQVERAFEARSESGCFMH